MLGLAFLIALLLLLLTDILGFNKVEQISTDKNSIEVQNRLVSKQALSLQDFKDKHQSDSTLTLSGINKEIYFINKGAFLDFATTQNKEATNVNDVRELMVSYLSAKSSLVQDVFAKDTAKLWAYINQYNGNVIDYFGKNTSKNKKVHELKNWNGLMVYNLADYEKELNNTDDLKQEPFSKNELEKEENLITNIPSSYKAQVGTKLLQLRLKEFKIDGDSLRFIYEIIGKHIYYNRKAVLNIKDGTINMEILGNAKLKTKQDGVVLILIEKGNYEFESID